MNSGFYILKRLLLVPVQVLVVLIITFVLIRLLPANPVQQHLSLVDTHAAYLKEKKLLGLDPSVLSQLGSYLGQLFQGHFGHSWQNGQSVGSQIAQHLPVTLQLLVLSFIVALLIGIPGGRALAMAPDRWYVKPLRFYSLFSGSQPDYFWGLIFIYVFYFLLRWAPAPLGLLSLGTNSPAPITNAVLVDSLLRGEVGTFTQALEHFVLPCLTLAFIVTGPIMKLAQEGMRSVLLSDHILYGQASGLSARTLRKRVLRNGLAPVATLTGVFFGNLIGGAVLIETVFSLNGLGQYALSSILDLDFPAVEGCLVVMTGLGLLVYVALDIVHSLLDPRVRLG
jgi:ABC-type dipeptide/oligopeptide/nickel transport system permease component